MIIYKYIYMRVIKNVQAYKLHHVPKTLCAGQLICTCVTVSLLDSRWRLNGEPEKRWVGNGLPQLDPTPSD